jgi:23S rRNA pseudouridine1911/1915/1917 synthase
VPPIQFVIDRREAGKTLAAVLKSRFGLSWAQAKRLVEKSHVKVSGQVETDVARRLKLGKRVELAAGTVEVKKSEEKGVRSKGKGEKGSKEHDTKPRERSRSTLHSSLPTPHSAPSLDPDVIVYADDAVVVVNKPAGLTTMRHADEAAEFGARGKRFLPKTLADLLPATLGSPNRPVIAVHRIDRDTSGLVVFARTREAADNLMKQFRKHTTERRYLALTRGTPATGRIESVLVRDRGDGRRGSTTDFLAEDGKRAITHVSVVETFGQFALVECRLETGRTHQVRIHLGESGAPLCGESVYDRPSNGKPLPDGSGATRPMLHAARLGFTHPESDEAVSWEVEPPEDFREVLEKLRGKSWSVS